MLFRLVAAASLLTASLAFAGTEKKPIQKLGFQPVKAVKVDFDKKSEDGRCVPNIVFTKSPQVEGFKCMELTETSSFAKVGILNGDVVKKIDGQMITSPDQMMNVLQKVKANQFAEIIIVRDGQEQSIHSQSR